MTDRLVSLGRAAGRYSRRDFLRVSVGAGLGLGAGYLLGCSAPAQPTATVTKPAPTSVAGAPSPVKVAPPAPTTVAASPQKVTFATTTGTLGLVTTVVKDQKLDLKYGLDLDLKTFDPAEAERAVALKRAEVGNYVPVSAATAAIEGIPIVLFAPVLWNHTFFVVHKDAPYEKPTDLKGKKIGTLTKITGLYTSAQVIFKELGMDFEKDFQIVTGPPMAIMAFLEKKEVEAIIIHEPLASQLLASGTYKIVGGANDMWKQITGRPMFMVGVGAHRDWYKQNGPAAQGLLKCVVEGAKYIQDHPETIDQFKNVIGLKTPEEVEITKKRLPPLIATQWDNEFIKNAQHIIDRAVELKIIAKAPEEPVFAVP